jgi:type VI secretion system protein ImpE
MPPEELVQSGKLREALTAFEALVRDKPAVARYRFSLFQLLSILGDWNRALAQLNVFAELGGDDSFTADLYRPALHCEVFRAEVFAGKLSPLVFGEPEEWVGLLIASNQALASGKMEDALALRRSALRLARTVSARIDGKPVDFIMDADARLGPVVEAVLEGKYFWIPLSRVKKLSVQAPTDLHDLVWARAEFTWSNDGKAAALIPVRYATPRSLVTAPDADAFDAPLLLARKTDWSNHGQGMFIGRGQRHWATRDGVIALFEAAEIEFDVPVPVATAAQIIEPHSATLPA